MICIAKKHHAYLRIFSFATTLTFLLMYSAVVFADSQQSDGAYPSTPEAVVEAFVKADFDGTANYYIGDIKIRAIYTQPGSEYARAYDGFGVVKSYKIKKIMQTPTEAAVQVIYQLISKSDVNKKGLEWGQEDVKQVYKLALKNGSWKITAPNVDPYVSTTTAIKVLNPTDPDYKPVTITGKINARDVCLLRKVDAGHSVSAALTADDCGLPYEKLLPSYPDTPEGVVETVVRGDFDGITDQEIGDPKKRLDYTIEQVDIGQEGFSIASSYEIRKLTQESSKATVQLRYKLIGALEFRSRLKIENENTEGIVNLRLRNGFWKIEGDPGEGPVSLKTAIKIVEKWLSRPEVKKATTTDDMRKKNILERNYQMLKKLEKEYDGGGK